MAMMLTGDLALVTGGGAGIGRATALRLAREGAAVAILDLDGEAASSVVREITRAGGDALAGQADFGDPTEVRGAIERVISIAERDISILINNVGINRLSPIIDMPLSDWEAIFRVNVTSAFVCTQEIARRMIQANIPGRIVNVSSRNAQSVSFPGYCAYASSKAAIIMLTRTAALELGPHHIRVNAVAPGTVETNMSRETLGDPSRRRYFERLTFLGKLGQPEDVAAVISFLVSDDSAHITGATVHVDGGTS